MTWSVWPIHRDSSLTWEVIVNNRVFLRRPPQKCLPHADDNNVFVRLGRNPQTSSPWRDQVAERMRSESLLGFHAIRVAAHLIVAVVIVVMPVDGGVGQRLAVAAAVALAGPATFAIAVAAPAGRRDLAGNLFLGLLGMTISAVLPVLWGASMVVLTAIAIGAIPLETRRVALTQVGFFAIGMGIVGWWRAVPHWFLPLIAVVVMTPSVERYYQYWRRRRAETNQQLADATELIRHQAEHDGLTGLITRAVFVAGLRRSLEHVSETDPVAVLGIAINRRQYVNEILGHEVGDQVLVVLARRFERLPFAAAVTRLGGDEFAIALTGTDASRATEHALAVLSVIEELVQVDRLKLSVSATVGIALAPQDGATAEVLIAHADTAKYRAKDARPPIMTFAESQGARAGDQFQRGIELDQAIRDGQIEVWFQPKIDLATERVVGAEGLARWRHPSQGVLSPDRFLSLLSITSDYQAFTDEVIRQGIAFAATTNVEGAGIAVALNLAAMSFVDHGLPDRVEAMLDASGVPPNQLRFEVTESEIIEDLSVNGPVFERITKLGIELSIDDFGVGYSSLSRLRELPVQELKIDRSFVARMESDPEDLIIVKAIVDLANVLGHRSVAEGVETVEAWERLREMGCDEAQGYLFGRPMPAAEFVAAYAATDGVRRFVLKSSDAPSGA